MKKWLQSNLNNIIVGSFLIPILLVAFVSISHVTTLYSLANPLSWAIYLSVAVEIAALAALAGVSAKFGKFIYLPFGIVTFIQFVGNFFYSYSHININSQDFKDWVDMISGLLEPIGVDQTDVVAHRRILAFITGGLIPFISLTFAHMLIVYSSKIQTNEDNIESVNQFLLGVFLLIFSISFIWYNERRVVKDYRLINEGLIDQISNISSLDSYQSISEI